MEEQAGVNRFDLSSEKGSALLIALLAVVLMTILGLVLMEVLRGGLTQAASSEARIQAEALAQKGLDDSLALIRHAVEEGNLAADYRSRITTVHNALGEYTASSGAPGGGTVLGFLEGNGSQAGRGSYSIDIIQADNLVKMPLAARTSPDSPYVYKLVVQSTGKVGEPREVTAEKKMTVYVSTINPVFRYPVSASGDMTLNGAPSVVGDVFVNGGLGITSRAQFVTNQDHTIGSDYPSLKGFVKVNGSSSYKYKVDGVVKSGLENSFFSKDIPFVDTSLPPAVDIDVHSIVAEKTAASPGSAFTKRGMQGFGQVITASGMDDYSLDTHPAGQSLRLDNRWTNLNGKLELSSGSSDPGGIWIDQGGLYLNDGAELVLKKGSLYIANDDPYMVAAHMGGKLTLNAGEYAAIRGNVTLYDGFKLSNGVMYISGDLKIIGNVSLNGTIYVDGNVEMKGLTSLSSTGALIIAAEGKMIMGDNAPNQEIRSFLYSKSDMTLYGVKSKLNIRGGIHGQNVTLNAVRGEVGTGITHTDSIPAAPFRFLSEMEQKLLGPGDSRLRIDYDSLLYEDPPSGIPTVDNVNVYVSQIEFTN